MVTSSKLNLAFGMLPTELSVAAANFNIDFSLVKCEAPKEYHGLRDSLTKIRRSEAEDGSLHRTARKLAALFKTCVPRIPQLTAAYGRRVSEISAASSENVPVEGLFGERCGPDGTTIWAAATSGEGAMAAHLLACMLARMWNGPEAIAIWMELIDQRKALVMRDVEGGSFDLPSAMAAKQDFPRPHIAAWDASARAWIKTADAVKRLEQTQLMLVIDNVQLEVNNSNAVYKSITQAWVGALQMTEFLLQGIPQRVCDGAVLLGLSCWHLYPPMLVITSKSTRIDHGDKLVPSWGLLTIGLHASDEERNGGLSWSLPLAHLQYYSTPVQSSRYVSQESSHVTIDQLSFVVLGSFVSSWVNQDMTVDAIIDAFVFIENEIFGSEDEKLPVIKPPTWLSRLFEIAKAYTRAVGLEREIATKLLYFGVRRGIRFLSTDAGKPEPLFGLLNMKNLLRCAPTTENKIQVFRIMSQLNDTPSYVPSSSRFLIRYKVQYPGSKEPCWEFADCHQQAHCTGERTDDGVEKTKRGVRWLTCNKGVRVSLNCNDSTCGCSMEATNVSHCDCVASGHRCSPACHPTTTGCHHFQGMPDILCDQSCHRVSGSCPSCRLRSRAQQIVDLQEECGLIPYNHLTLHDDGTFSLVLNHGSKERYRHCYGNSKDVAVFVRHGEPLGSFAACDSRPPTIHFDHVKNMVRSGLLSLRGYFDKSFSINRVLKPDNLRKPWAWQETVASPSGGQLRPQANSFALPIQSQHMTPKKKSPWKSMQRHIYAIYVFEAMQQLFSTMPGAVFSLSAFRSPISANRWAPGLLEAPNILSSKWRASAFACITMVESGGHDVDVARMESVMALAVGDSIYVAAPLVQDPSSIIACQPIKRILGNIGRPGVSLLVPPADPRSKQVDNDSWQLVNHTPWDGRFENNFENVSLHLAFTDFEMPVDIGNRGMRDHEVMIVEAVVQVFDKQEWISDLDIISAFDKPLFLTETKLHCRHQLPNGCGGSNSSSSHGYHDHEHGHSPPRTSPMSSMVTVDNWSEYVEKPPHQLPVFRASGNWQARIAAAAMAPRNGYFVWVWPKQNVHCASCLLDSLQRPTVLDSDIEKRVKQRLMILL